MVNFHVFSRVDLTSTPDFREVSKSANSVLEILNKKSVKDAISEAHVFGASSHTIQKAILPSVLELGFSSEKKHLFSEYKVGGLRPDYYKPLSKGGILFEVERGKTIANNIRHAVEHGMILNLLNIQKSKQNTAQMSKITSSIGVWNGE